MKRAPDQPITLRAPLPLARATLALLVSACGRLPDPNDDGTPEVDIPPMSADGACLETASDDELPTIDVHVELLKFAQLVGNEDPQLEVPVTLCVNGVRFDGGELELHGGLGRRHPKKSFRVKFPDHDEVVSRVFGEDDEDYHRWVLQASWIDPTFVRNALTLMLSRRLGVPTPRTGFGRLHINGAFYGLMVVIERVDRQFVRRQGFNPDGNLYKAVSHSADWRAKDDPLKGYEHKVDQDGGEDLAQLLDAIATTPHRQAAFEAEIETRVDVSDFETWQIVHTFAMDRDTFTKNYYLHHDVDAPQEAPDGVFRIFPWDADATWGISWNGTEISPVDTRHHGGQPWTESREVPTDGFAGELLSVPEYRRAYIERYARHLREDFEPALLEAQLRGWAERISDLARRDLAQWQPDRDFEAELERLVDVVYQRHGLMTEVIDELSEDEH